MQPSKTPANNKNLYRFAVLFIAGFFAGILITYFITSSGKTTSAADKSTTLLLKETDSLKSEFSSLQNLNSNYSSILEKTNLDTTQLFYLDSLNVLITKREIDFLEHLDNIQIVNSNVHNNSSELLVSIVDGFRISVKQSSALNAIRNSVNMGNTNYSFDQNMLATMQRELRTKEVELIMVRKQISGNGDTVRIARTLAVTTDSSADNLLTTIRKRNDVLTTTNKKLQSDVQQLKNQLGNIKLTTQVSSSVISSRSNEYANEQISLAQADCYLARADVNQIISNSRQRTELLQNALKILNSLSNSANNDIRQKVQSKFVMLKKIAADNHD